MSANLPLDEHLCFALYSASMAINRLYKPLLDRLGITYPQYLVLNALWEQDGRSIGAIARRLSLEPSTITPLVKRLEANGLVTRARDRDDERSVVVTLTQKAQALQAQTRCLGETLLQSSGMSAEDLMALNRQVSELRKSLAQSQPGD